ncbi:YncE family protein [Pontibacter sp. KCTC 32443]|uniref:YncE family protein n=1 Tax=Pontibacter TaxID=323449 RepID=UPI00164D8768|nr:MULTISPECIES: YncE family protein [Pontibacter]MBC5774130.1 YncE family protein [Pontibacter sp. KCTC 32443]
MKRNNLFRSFYMAAVLFTSSFAFTSCESSEETTPVATTGKGVYILNEGNFGTPNGSVSYYDKDTKQVTHNLFSRNNEDRPLGDVVQSMAMYGDRAFIVVNNSNKIEVVHPETFKSVGVVQDLKSPRYFVFQHNGRGYVTEWVNYGERGQVSVIDLNTYTVTGTIPVGYMPEQMLLSNGKLYVANSGDNTISIINTATNIVENTFQVSDGPSELVQDKDHHIWILSAGKVVYNDDWSAIDYTKTTPGALIKFNTISNGIAATYTLPSNQSIPKNLTINDTKDKLYYNYQGKTYAQPVAATGLSSEVVINRSFYGMEADHRTGNIYGSDNNNFSGDGTVFIYNDEGVKLHEFKAGIGPNSFVFN